MARIAIPADEPSLAAPSRVHVPRAPYFIVIDTGGDWEAVPNPGATAESHPGAHAAKALVKQGVQAVVGHRMGPHPVHALEKAGVIVYQGDDGVPVQDMLARFTSGSLPAMTPEAILAGHSGCTHR